MGLTTNIGCFFALAFLCLHVASAQATGNPTYLAQILVPDDYTNDTTTQFACSIQVAHSGSGAVIASRVADLNATVLTIYDSSAALLATVLAETFNDVGTNVSTLACKATISDNLQTIFFSISTGTPGDATNPAQVDYISGDPSTGNYTVINSWTSDGVSSTARSVASSADGMTTIFSVPTTNFLTSHLEVWIKNTSDIGSAVYQAQSIFWAVNDSTAAWNDDVDMSTNGNTIFVLSPTQGSIYVYDRTAFGKKYEFTTVLTYNTSGTPFTSFAAAGDGLSVFATFDWTVTNSDNSTTEYNGVAFWSYDATQLAWDTTPVIITSGVATLNTTTNITTIAYTYKIAAPISVCKQGMGFQAPVYVNSTTSLDEQVLFGSFNEAADGTWALTNFPAPDNSTWPLGTGFAIRQISPSFGTGIGFSHTLSDSGALAIVPTQQSNSTDFAYWADAYTTVTDCGQTSAPVSPPVVGSSPATWTVVAFVGLATLTVIVVAFTFM